MPEVVDSIIAELIARDNGYTATFEKAIAVHEKFTASVPKIGAALGISSADAQKYADRHKKAANDVAAASEASSARVSKAAKAAGDSQAAAAKIAEKAQRDLEAAQKRTAAAEEKAAARAATASLAEQRRSAERIARLRAEEQAASNQAKATAFLVGTPSGKSARDSASVFAQNFKAEEAAAASSAKMQASAAAAAEKRASAEKLASDETVAAMAREEAARARIAAMVARSTSGGGVIPGSGRNLGITLPNERHGQASIPASVLAGDAGTAEVAASEEINHLAVDLITLRATLVALAGREKQEAQDLAAEMMLQKRLLAEGVAEEEILLRIEERRALVSAKRSSNEKAQTSRQTARGAEQFARGAGAYAALGGAPAVAGLAVAATVAGVTEAVKSGLEYAQTLKALSDQLGITTIDLQKYEAVANTLGVTQNQLRESLSQLASNLGRAQEGSEQQSKIFSKLNIDIGNSKEGFKSLSDVLPTFLDRLSKIPSQSQRFAIETALGGEQLRRLDPVLSRGADGFDQLANSVSGASDMLSNEQIQKAAETANKLKLLGDQLERDLTGTIANNAKEIEALATAFFKLAGNAIQAINALQRFGAHRVLNNPFSSDSDKQQARDLINATPQGRTEALDRIGNSWKALNEAAGPGGQSFGSIYIDGIGNIPNTPAGRDGARQKLRDQRSAIIAAQRADAAQNTPVAVQPGSPGDVSHLFSPKPKKARKGKSEKTLENEEDQRNKRFADQLAGFQEAELRAEEEATADIERRADIEKQLADRAYAKQLGDIETQRKVNVRNGETPAQADQQARDLAAAAKRAHDRDIDNINTKKQVDLTEASLTHQEVSLQLQSEMLGYQQTLAKTAKERRDIDLRLLDLAIQQEKLELEKQRAALKPGDPALDDINAKIDALPAKRAAQAAVLKQNDAGPIAKWRQSLDDPNTQVEQAVADKLKSVDEAITDEAAKVLGVKDPFLRSLLQIFLEQNVLKPLYDAMSQAGSGSSGGFFGSLLSSFSHIFGGGGSSAANTSVASSAAFNVPGFGIGFASGGSMVIGGNPGVDQNQLSLNGQPIARVGHGEILQVLPNVAASNKSVAARSGGGSVTVLQPINVDARGAVMNDDFAKLILQKAGQQSQQISAAYSKAAVDASPARLQRQQTLGS